ncbi:MAG: 2-succinyl-5-enolpyruvyl-6-hydroxy-3-cyclohexene-1-carboxylic-acid synthase [Acidimicrobiales bacterium]|nr:2-succinyl-5-enolpyruvyl-6-hydroxy-3-cyclohexene-1-carboxylic-acid synthase [Acidimicrobiales bacterium]
MPTPPVDPAMPSPPPSPSLVPEPADLQATFAATLVDEWVRDGLSDAVVCPGSRSTPLALELAAHDGVRVHVHHDERSGAFLALGLGLATGRPALVLTTSGTAAAELHPAVVEADLAAVPLLVCTADRPPELRDVGVPQAIDQVHLFGRSVRWYGDPGVPETAGRDRWRPLAARAYAAAVGDRPGPVHVNLPFREPLVGTAGPLPLPRPGRPWTTVVGGVAADAAGAPESDVVALVDDIAGRRGVLVAGLPAAPGLDGPAVHAAAAALGWPVVAEPRSPSWIDAPTLVGHLDAILRSPRAADRLRPEVIVRIGGPGSSRVVSEWLAASGAREVVVGAAGWSDPAGTADTVVPGPADGFVWALAAAARGVDRPRDHDDWASCWRAAAAAAAEVVAATVPADSEPGVARTVIGALPDAAHLVVSSSMPIRDLERYADAPAAGALTVHANRGANGIDGVVSTAVGVALASDGPTGLLIGDVAFLHDSNGLLGAAGRGADLVCVVVDNDGGGIFSFLPQARELAADQFECLFGTPHGVDLVALAAAYGLDARRVEAGADLAAAVADAAAAGGVRVLVVTTDRAANVAVHRRIDDAVAAAVEDALAT